MESDLQYTGVSQDGGRRVLIGSRVNHNSDSSEERALRSPQDRNECFYKQHRGADKRPVSSASSITDCYHYGGFGGGLASSSRLALRVEDATTDA
ncbi:unnamed protein product [Gadus morhua 'NCC']